MPTPKYRLLAYMEWIFGVKIQSLEVMPDMYTIYITTADEQMYEARHLSHLFLLFLSIQTGARKVVEFDRTRYDDELSYASYRTKPLQSGKAPIRPLQLRKPWKTQ